MSCYNVNAAQLLTSVVLTFDGSHMGLNTQILQSSGVVLKQSSFFFLQCLISVVKQFIICDFQDHPLDKGPYGNFLSS